MEKQSIMRLVAVANLFDMGENGMEDIYESEHTLLQYIFKIYKSTIREAAPALIR